eukprot:CAMPEP_0114613810 /NCGR_PEP_ID=MMETSP0168-20121206/5327_1 /TAXON_ID=95228 ORGANISM="Vannella sp., Strain DIVA3 517/6/12" /NCGR_SAMPLE_ID=MMETSP0168 /ASSEMBLY_ACC=CAM_ASM_000044 /LENGTH=458 /DNA_ID=CAMNT_0001824833 /DNA_START=40 /DNA_END=1416 /DNA_ORIENTATION=+
MSILSDENKVYADALGAVGNTPLIRLNRVSRDLKCELFAKCEFFNAGGSVKDRIGKRMVLEGLKDGTFKQGDHLVEPTSGNTGIGLALASAVTGLKMTATMPKKMSNEKIAVLKALGGGVVRTPTEAAFDDPDSHISVAERMRDSSANVKIPDQYSNQYNLLAHIEGTAEEIYRQTQGKLDMVVVGAGTGGTITGIAKRLKELIPGVKVVGVDPVGSILAGPDTSGESYMVEGIGYDFLPKVFDGGLVDVWYKSRDHESFNLARRLIKEEGLLVGGSAGSALAATLKHAAELKEGQRCVVLFADSIRNYLTKFADDRWMYDHGFYEPATNEKVPSGTAADLIDASRPTIDGDDSVGAAKELLASSGATFLPLVTNGVARGIVTKTSLMNFLFDEGDVDGKAVDAGIPVPRYVSSDTPLARLRYTLEINDGIAVVADKNAEGKREYKGAITTDDLFKKL